MSYHRCVHSMGHNGGVHSMGYQGTVDTMTKDTMAKDRGMNTMSQDRTVEAMMTKKWSRTGSRHQGGDNEGLECEKLLGLSCLSPSGLRTSLTFMLLL